jgi:hypothetical protein
MTSPTARTTLFPRSTRAIHADSLAPGLAILIVLMVLLFAWILWLVLFNVPFYQTSQSAQVTPEAMVVADFPLAVLSQIHPGQEALFVPSLEKDGATTTGKTLTARVAEVDTTQGRVWLLLTADRAAQSHLYPGLPGQVQVVVKEQSPLSLIVEAVRMDG